MLRVLAPLLAAVLLALPARAQADGSAADAARLAAADSAGRAAAGSRPVAGYFLTSFAGGLAAGVLLPAGFLMRDEGIGAMGGAGAALVIGTTARAGGEAELPAHVAAEVENQPDAWREAYHAAYADQLRRRRTRASLWGGGIGAGVGVGAVVYLVATLASTDF